MTNEEIISKWIAGLYRTVSLNTRKQYANAIHKLMRDFDEAGIATPIPTWGQAQARCIQDEYEHSVTLATMMAVVCNLMDFCQTKLDLECAYWNYWHLQRVTKLPTNIAKLNLSVTALETRFEKYPKQADNLRTAFYLTRDFGLRIDEAAKLTLAHVMLGDTICLSITGKGDKIRLVEGVHLTDNVEVFLRERWQALFDLNAGNLSQSFVGLSRRQINHYLSKLLSQPFPTQHQSSKVRKPQSPHHLRHAKVNQLLEHGITLSEAARYVGHTTPKTTVENYVHQVPSRFVTPQAVGMPLTLSLAYVAACLGVSAKTIKNDCDKLGLNRHIGRVSLETAIAIAEFNLPQS